MSVPLYIDTYGNIVAKEPFGLYDALRLEYRYFATGDILGAGRLSHSHSIAPSTSPALNYRDEHTVKEKPVTSFAEGASFYDYFEKAIWNTPQYRDEIMRRAVEKMGVRLGGADTLTADQFKQEYRAFSIENFAPKEKPMAYETPAPEKLNLFEVYIIDSRLVEDNDAASIEYVRAASEDEAKTKALLRRKYGEHDLDYLNIRAHLRIGGIKEIDAD